MFWPLRRLSLLNCSFSFCCQPLWRNALRLCVTFNICSKDAGHNSAQCLLWGRHYMLGLCWRLRIKRVSETDLILIDKSVIVNRWNRQMIIQSAKCLCEAGRRGKALIWGTKKSNSCEGFLTEARRDHALEGRLWVPCTAGMGSASGRPGLKGQ